MCEVNDAAEAIATRNVALASGRAEIAASRVQMTALRADGIASTQKMLDAAACARGSRQRTLHRDLLVAICACGR